MVGYRRFMDSPSHFPQQRPTAVATGFHVLCPEGFHYMWRLCTTEDRDTAFIRLRAMNTFELGGNLRYG